MAVGLGVGQAYNGSSATTLAVQGTLDAISAGILLYTGLVEVRFPPAEGHIESC
jgi:zinc transporter 1/2/3